MRRDYAEQVRQLEEQRRAADAARARLEQEARRQAEQEQEARQALERDSQARAGETAAPALGMAR